MKHAIAITLCAALTGCAHMPGSLTEWEAQKKLKLAACIAEEPKTRSEGLRCLGPNYMRDLGESTSQVAHTWLSSLPEAKE